MASDAQFQIDSETTPLVLQSSNMTRGRENNAQGAIGSQRTTPTCGSPAKAAIGLLLLVVVLSFTVLSKLTLISMTSRLKAALAREEQGAAVSLYWQLLLVIMVPQCVTFARTMMRGVCGKRTATFPWPTLRAQLMVSPYIITFMASGKCIHRGRESCYAVCVCVCVYVCVCVCVCVWAGEERQAQQKKRVKSIIDFTTDFKSNA